MSPKYIVTELIIIFTTGFRREDQNQARTAHKTIMKIGENINVHRKTGKLEEQQNAIEFHPFLFEK